MFTDRSAPFHSRLQHAMLGHSPPLALADLVRLSGLDRSVVSRVVNGSRPPSEHAISCIAGVLRIDAASLVAGTDAESRLKDRLQVVPRADLAEALAQLAEADARRVEAETRLAGAESATVRQTDARVDAERRVGALLGEVDSLRRERDTAFAEVAALKCEHAAERSSRRRAEDDTGRALAFAAAEITQLRIAVEEARSELQDAQRTSKLGATLAGVAAGASVMTVATLLARAKREPEAPEPEDR